MSGAACRVGVGFVFHSPDFSVEAPGGFAECRRCLGLLDIILWTRESCPGAPAARPVPPDAIPCALCGAPLIVDPMHRATVALFGSTCAGCFASVPE